MNGRGYSRKGRGTSIDPLSGNGDCRRGYRHVHIVDQGVGKGGLGVHDRLRRGIHDLPEDGEDGCCDEILPGINWEVPQACCVTKGCGDFRGELVESKASVGRAGNKSCSISDKRCVHPAHIYSPRQDDLTLPYDILEDNEDDFMSASLRHLLSISFLFFLVFSLCFYTVTVQL